MKTLLNPVTGEKLKVVDIFTLNELPGKVFVQVMTWSGMVKNGANPIWLRSYCASFLNNGTLVAGGFYVEADGYDTVLVDDEEMFVFVGLKTPNMICGYPFTVMNGVLCVQVDRDEVEVCKPERATIVKYGSVKDGRLKLTRWDEDGVRIYPNETFKIAGQSYVWDGQAIIRKS